MIHATSENSILFTSEKGGAGKSTLLSNITSIISYQFDESVLVVDADVTNQSTTRTLLSTVDSKDLESLEQRDMLLTTETLANGLFKRRSPLFLPSDILDAPVFANALTDASNPVSYRIVSLMTEDAQRTLSMVDTRKGGVSSLLPDLIVGELNTIIEKDNLYDEEVFKDVTLSSNTKQLLREYTDNKENGIHVESKQIKKFNRELLLDAYTNDLTRGKEFTPEMAFRNLWFKATPKARISPQTLFMVPSKGRTRFDHRFNPMEIVDDMNKINDGFLSLYNHVFYDTEATSNVLKTSLFEMDNVELVSVITPHNIDIELDMLSVYEGNQIKGVILNYETHEHVHEHVDLIKGHGYPIISIVPFDTHMSEKMLQGNMSLVVGDGSNLDYVLRITALNLLKLNALDSRQIDKIFTDPRSVFTELSNKMAITNSVDGEISVSDNASQKKSSSNKTAKTTNKDGFLSKITNALGSNVNN